MVTLTTANETDDDDGNKPDGIVYECLTCSKRFDPADQPLGPKISKHVKSAHTNGKPVDWREFVELVSGDVDD